MECPHCHAMLADGAKFCPYCGNALDAGGAAGGAAVEQTAPQTAVEGGPVPVVPGEVASPAPVADGSGQAPHKKPKRKAVTIAVACVAAFAVACGGGALYYMHQQQVEQQAVYESAHSKHAVIVTVSAQGWDTKAGSSRVPVRVKGKDVDGKKVDKVFYVDSAGKGIKLIQGKYKFKAAGSPIAADGTVYKVPCTSAELTLDDVFSKGEKIDLADLAEKDSIFDFTPIDAVDVTDDDISAASALASQDKGKGAADADALSQAATKRRDDAVAAKKAADEEAARQAEEQRKAAARHIEARTFSVDLPEYWDGRVTTEVDGDTITVRSKLYPEKVVVVLDGSTNPDRNMGDIAGGAITVVQISDDFYVRLARTRWSYLAADQARQLKQSGEIMYSDEYKVSEEEATELTDLQSLGSVSYKKYLSDYLASNEDQYENELRTQDKAMQDALTPNLKLR